MSSSPCTDRKRGYGASALTMQSNTSSSVSPGNGHCGEGGSAGCTGHSQPTPTSRPWPPRLGTHLTHQHLVQQHAQPPPVHGPCVGLLGQHLGGQELWGAAEGAGPIPKANPCKSTSTSKPAQCVWSTVTSVVVRTNSQPLCPPAPNCQALPHSRRWEWILGHQTEA